MLCNVHVDLNLVFTSLKIIENDLDSNVRVASLGPTTDPAVPVKGNATKWLDLTDGLETSRLHGQ